MRIHIISLVIALALAGSAFTEPPSEVNPEIEITFVGLPEMILRGNLELDPVRGGESKVVVPITGSRSLKLKLPEGSLWRVTVVLEGAWAASSLLTVAGDQGKVTYEVPLVATGRISGRIQLPDGEGQIPEKLDLRIELTEPPTKSIRIPTTTIECGVGEQGLFSCEAPAARLDLNLKARGYISHFRWGLDVPAGKVADLGSLRLRRGASLVGYAETVEGPPPPKTARAKLLLDVAEGGAGARLRQQLAKTTLEAPISEKGFFHFQDIAPGTYVLTVEAAGFAPALIRPVEILPDSETVIGKTISLERPLDLTLRLEPPLDWKGEPWSAQVLRAARFSSTFDSAPVFAGSLSQTGEAVIQDQGPGAFRVRIRDSIGSQVAAPSDWVVTGLADSDFLLKILQIVVRGEVFYGDKRIYDAKLFFGGRNGALRAEMETDEEGEFIGVLPRKGEWIVTVDVPSEELRTDLKVTVTGDEEDLVLEIPDTEIFGMVVDQNGIPVPDARVTAGPEATSVTVETNQRGEFTFRGLLEGATSLAARSGPLRSPALSAVLMIMVQDSQPAGPFRLELTESEELTGRVVASSGPVPGAIVNVSSEGLRGAAMTQTARTDLDGSFQIAVVPGAHTIGATVSPPGFSFKAFQLTPGEKEQILVVSKEAGELVLQLPLLAQEVSRHLAIFQDSTAISVGKLWSWARSYDAYWPLEGGTWRVPGISPGFYRVCMDPVSQLKSAALQTGHWQQGLKNCAEGFLAPGSTLELQLDAEAGQSAIGLPQ